MQFAPRLDAADTIKESSVPLDRSSSTVMGDELPILKGILNGVVNYHNARRCSHTRNRHRSFHRTIGVYRNVVVVFLFFFSPTFHDPPPADPGSRDFLTEEGFVARGQGSQGTFVSRRGEKVARFPLSILFPSFFTSCRRSCVAQRTRQFILPV